ncbi:hypothetical protein REPUB_Repub16aG0079800 [Reevesia pubescens]
MKRAFISLLFVLATLTTLLSQGLADDQEQSPTPPVYVWPWFPWFKWSEPTPSPSNKSPTPPQPSTLEDKCLKSFTAQYALKTLHVLY